MQCSAFCGDTKSFFYHYHANIEPVNCSNIFVTDKLFDGLKAEIGLAKLTANDEFHLLHFKVSNVLLSYRRSIFHGTAFFWHHKAWIFTAPSGVGKSTQYKNWKKLFKTEVRIINGDKPVLEFKEDNSIIVHPSPWMGKERWGSMLKAPLGGIIYLEQGKENKIERMKLRDAVKPIYKQFLYLPEKEEHVHAVCRLEESLLQNIPIWKLTNKGDLDSAQLTHDTLLKWLETHGEV